MDKNDDSNTPDEQSSTHSGNGQGEPSDAETLAPDIDSEQDDDNRAPPEEAPERLSQPASEENAPRLPFPVVGIGASAGGLEAYIEFLQHMSSDSGMAFVLIQHLSPSRESMIAEILSRHTTMPVAQVEDGMEVLPNHVYVIRPGYTMTIKNGHLHLGASLLKPGNNRPIDDFFRSLAEEQRQRAIAVIFSGMGSNGTAGGQAVKAVGGVCIAQDPDSAKYPSMPRHLIDAGLADFILQPKEVPAALLRYAAHPYAKEDMSAERVAREERQTLSEILTIVRTRHRHDFNGYKKPTVVRRVQRRMGLLQVTKMSDYARVLRQNPGEVAALSDDMMIHVTGFFRDPDAWEVLRERVIRPLIADREDDAPIRAWVTACSSGEEAYTLAILLSEAAERAGKHFDIKIFATDTAERSLSQARAGVFPGGIESEISPERLDRYFEKDSPTYRIKKEIRELVVFAPQNVLQDPPFSRLDICTCRNLLIYLEPDVQRRVLSLLHFGLREGGVLMLGTSETTSGTDSLFEPIDKSARIFRRVGPTRHGALDFPLPRAVQGRPVDYQEHKSSRQLPRPTVTHVARQVLIESYTPAAVVVDRQGRIVFFHGKTSQFLDQPQGEPTRELVTLTREPVRHAVRQLLQQATQPDSTDGGILTVRGGTIDTDDGRRRIEVSIRPLQHYALPTYFLVAFNDYPEPTLSGQPLSDSDSDSDVSTLHDELQRVRDELQSTIEELQTSNEEMKASHEEITSINEELQSSNEELETSKEELQSLNEELTTVNAQLQAKMEELERTTNDLSSLLASTDIAVVFLDSKFRIRRYTPAIRNLMDLIPSDINRPFNDLARKFSDPALLDDARLVLDRLVPIEREIASEDDRWYVRKVLPYRTADNRISGVVVTFVDVTERRLAVSAQERAEEELRLIIQRERLARAQAEAANSAKDDFLANVSHELRTPLSAILLWAKMLSNGVPRPEVITEGLAAIVKSAESQKQLIEDLLDTTRIASGKLRLNLEECSLAEVVESAVEAIRPTADNKEIVLEKDFGSDIGVVRIDADRIRQVVWNLLNNAVKFTASGGRVTVGLWRRDGHVELRVADTGRGISPEMLNRIFERFDQVEPSENRQNGGLGLGLTISRQLVELHGGTIMARSDGAGTGAIFTVMLPLPKLADTAKQPVSRRIPTTLQGVQILLVEDDDATRNALSAVLKIAGAQVQAVSSGNLALEHFEKHKPRLIVSDINMPDMDGNVLMRQIREMEAVAKRQPVLAVAFSALSRTTDRARTAASGYNHHLSKPVDADELLAVLQSLLSQHV